VELKLNDIISRKERRVVITIELLLVPILLYYFVDENAPLLLRPGFLSIHISLLVVIVAWTLFVRSQRYVNYLITDIRSRLQSWEEEPSLSYLLQRLENKANGQVGTTEQIASIIFYTISLIMTIVCLLFATPLSAWWLGIPAEIAAKFSLITIIILLLCWSAAHVVRIYLQNNLERKILRAIQELPFRQAHPSEALVQSPELKVGYWELWLPTVVATAITVLFLIKVELIDRLAHPILVVGPLSVWLICTLFYLDSFHIWSSGAQIARCLLKFKLPSSPPIN